MKKRWKILIGVVVLFLVYNILWFGLAYFPHRRLIDEHMIRREWDGTLDTHPWNPLKGGGYFYHQQTEYFAYNTLFPSYLTSWTSNYILALVHPEEVYLNEDGGFEFMVDHALFIWTQVFGEDELAFSVQDQRISQDYDYWIEVGWDRRALDPAEQGIIDHYQDIVDLLFDQVDTRWGLNGE